MTVYEWAFEEVGSIVERVIEEVEEHRDLKHASILCVFRDGHAKSRGRAVLGQARKVSGLMQFLVDEKSVGSPLFLLVFPKDLWVLLKPEQKRALVDHELCHLQVERNDNSGEWVGHTRGHDVEEFFSIVDRHGLWKSDVARLVKTGAAQDPLFDAFDLDALNGDDDEPGEDAPPEAEEVEPDEELDEPAPAAPPPERGGLRAVPDPFAEQGVR